jgi:hypothetical protein
MHDWWFKIESCLGSFRRFLAYFIASQVCWAILNSSWIQGPCIHSQLWQFFCVLKPYKFDSNTVNKSKLSFRSFNNICLNQKCLVDLLAIANKNSDATFNRILSIYLIIRLYLDYFLNLSSIILSWLVSFVLVKPRFEEFFVDVPNGASQERVGLELHFERLNGFFY